MLEDLKLIIIRKKKMLNSTGFHLYIVAFAILATGQFWRSSFPGMHWIMHKVLWDERCYINSKALWTITAKLLFKSQMQLPLLTWHMPFKLTQLSLFPVLLFCCWKNLHYSSWELTVSWNTINEVSYFIPLP